MYAGLLLCFAEGKADTASKPKDMKGFAVYKYFFLIPQSTCPPK